MEMTLKQHYKYSICDIQAAYSDLTVGGNDK